MQKLSIVIPIYNEEKNIPELYRRLKNVLKSITTKYEIIFVDDGSHDKSFSALKKLRIHDKKVKIIHFSRNFGHMPALSAGLSASTGNKVVVMDADLQDPPEIISKMHKLTMEGYDVIYGVKIGRKESALKRLLFLSFYRILNSISSYKMPLDAGTFSMIDHRVVKVLNALPERNKYFSGMRAWAGFKQTSIIYKRGARAAGSPKTFAKLLELATNGLISFSYLPLRFASIFGFICAGLSFMGIVAVLILRAFFGLGIVGWASTMSAILLVGGIQLITTGIIGEYLARIYDEVKGRPEYIIEEKIGF